MEPRNVEATWDGVSGPSVMPSGEREGCCSQPRLPALMHVFRPSWARAGAGACSLGAWLGRAETPGGEKEIVTLSYTIRGHRVCRAIHSRAQPDNYDIIIHSTVCHQSVSRYHMEINQSKQ